jgi:hypothetical protein
MMPASAFTSWLMYLVSSVYKNHRAHRGCRVHACQKPARSTICVCVPWLPVVYILSHFCIALRFTVYNDKGRIFPLSGKQSMWLNSRCLLEKKTLSRYHGFFCFCSLKLNTYVRSSVLARKMKLLHERCAFFCFCLQNQIVTRTMCVFSRLLQKSWS